MVYCFKMFVIVSIIAKIGKGIHLFYSISEYYILILNKIHNLHAVIQPTC